MRRDLKRGALLKTWTMLCGAVLLLATAVIIARPHAQGPNTANEVNYDGAAWSLKGEGIVCCPCTTPCPCRTNSEPSYGHCEATLYLRIRQGHYGPVSLDGLQVVDSGGMCAVRYQRLTALYFDKASNREQRQAFLKLLASMAPHHEATFPYVRTVPLNAQVTGDHFFSVIIPGILEMKVDRNWGQSSAPMPEVAAPDYFANVIQYAENLRYIVHDPQANLNFDYSRRQANYRKVNLNNSQYQCRSMLIQYEDGTGGFNAQQLRLIHTQHLPVAQPASIRKMALRLREAGSQ